MATEEDDELSAMASIRAALAPLDEVVRARVLRWALDRFKVSTSGSIRSASLMGQEGSPVDLVRRESMDLAALYHAVSPKTDMEKVLAVCYWLKTQGQADIESYRVNSELKQLGFGIGNVTRAFDKLAAQKPQPIIQTRKSGTSAQARKTFRITDHGTRTIERMLAGGTSDMGPDDSAENE